MSNLSSNSLPKAKKSGFFSHLYVEDNLRDDTFVQTIISKFSRSKVIDITHYKDIFNRNNQSFRAQSNSKNLILAKKEAPFLYKGSYFSDGFEFENFFYTPSMLGCMYDCDYCYLQGMYNSANTVVFVNLEDFFDELLPYLNNPTLVAISYDTDTLAIEKIINHSARWIEFASYHDNLHLEIRTKSANFKAIAHLSPTPNLVLAWSISPQEIIDAYEHHTPTLNKRLASINEAIEARWQVRVCIDPVIYNENFETLYPSFIDTVFTTIDASKVYQLTLGSFRMSSVHLKRIKKMQSSDIAFYPYSVEENIASYPKDTEQYILKTLKEKALHYIDEKRIRIWQLQ